MIDLDKYFIAMPSVADYIFQDHLTDHLLSDIFKVNEQLRNIKHLAEYGFNASKVGDDRVDYAYLLGKILEECDR